MEAVRSLLGIESWVVAGGSWGSALSLVYAQAHPNRTIALFLFCLWTARIADLRSWFELGHWIHPETYAEVVAGMTENEQSDPLATLIQRIQTGSPEESRIAAARLHDFEVILMNLNAPLDRIGYDVELYGRIFAHYISNNCFLEPDQILNDAARLADIPITIVQGRYDLCTPPKIAFDFLKVAPHAELRVIDEASHSPAERNFLREIVRAGEDIYRQIRSRH
jgi:proline iminopeptidase